jgi:hypothetical protein
VLHVSCGNQRFNDLIGVISPISIQFQSVSFSSTILDGSSFHALIMISNCRNIVYQRFINGEDDQTFSILELYQLNVCINLILSIVNVIITDIKITFVW